MEINRPKTNPSTQPEKDNHGVTVKPKTTANLGDYYNQYSGLASQYGLTPMDQKTFESKFTGTDPQGDFIQNVLLPLHQQIGDQVNSSISANNTNTGTTGGFINTAYNYGDWRGKSASDIINNINNDYSVTYKNAQDAAANYKPPATVENDPVAKQVMDELNGIVAKGGGTFTAPDSSTEAAYIQNWNKQLQQLNQPTTDYYTGILNKQVNDSYVANNPYSVGSGNQIQATQDATNAFLMNTASQQQAQALALGQGQYQNDYNTAWNMYQNQQAQYNQANAQKLQIASMNSQQLNADYWKNQENAWQTTAIGQAQAYQAQQQQQQQAWAQQMASMQKPQQADWYQSLIPAAITAGGMALAPLTGGASLYGALAANTGYGLYNSSQPNYSGGNYGTQAYNPNYGSNAAYQSNMAGRNGAYSFN